MAWSQIDLYLAEMTLTYSYANTSRTVSLEALRAGMKLARALNTMTVSSQTHTPVIEKAKFSGDPDMDTPTASLINLLIGYASSEPKNQLSKPMRMPSMMKTRVTPRLGAPMARSTPISRVRSSTLILIVPINPSPPTRASKPAMISIRLITIP